MATPAIDYDALAKQHGATGSAPPSAAIDYDALAKRAGAISSQPAGPAPAAASQGTPPAASSHWYDTALHAAEQVGVRKERIEGFGQAAASSVAGAAHLIDRASPTTGALLHFVPGYDGAVARIQAEGDKPADTWEKQLGATAENILEFAGGEEAFKAMSMGEKVAHLGKLASTLEKFPSVARVMAKQGLLGAAQGTLHGEDATQALTTGAATGATAGLLHGAGAAAGKLIDKVMPGVRSIAGVDIPELASQRPGAGATAESGATIDTQPKYQAAQQAGSKQVVGNIAQQATRDSLERLNTTRVRPAAITDPARMLPAPENMKPFQFTMEGAEPDGGVTSEPAAGRRDYPSAGTREVPNPDATPAGAAGRQAQVGSVGNVAPDSSFAGKPTRTVSNWQEMPPTAQGEVKAGATFATTDPAVAHATMTRLDDLMETPEFDAMGPRQQARIQRSADALRAQLDEHGAYQARASHFDPVDAEGAARQVGNFREAADQIEGSVKGVFRKLDEVSGGDWNGLRKQQIATQKILRNPSSTTAYDAAQQRLDDIEGKIGDLFEQHKDQISPDEWRAAKGAWKDASTLRTIHSTLERSFNGVPEDVAAAGGPARVMRGGEPTYKALGRMLDKRGDDVRRVIGQEGVVNLYRMADLLKTPESAQSTKRGIAAVGSVLRRHLPGLSLGGAVGGAIGGITGHGVFHGALAGVSSEVAAREVLHRIATNPEMATRLSYAVRNNVSHRIAAPLIASMMLQAQQQPTPPQPDTASQP